MVTYLCNSTLMCSMTFFHVEVMLANSRSSAKIITNIFNLKGNLKLVTNNGPFVDRPSFYTHSELNGGQLVQIPQSGSVCLSSHSVACIGGSLKEITRQVRFAKLSEYQKVFLSLPASVVAQSQEKWPSVTQALKVKDTQNWLVNGVEQIFSWSNVRLKATKTPNMIVISGDGHFSLRGGRSTLQLAEGQRVLVQTQSLLATNCKFTEGSLLKRIDKFEELTDGLILSPPFFRNFVFKIKTLAMNLFRPDAAISPKESIGFSENIQLSGPGLVILMSK